MGISKRKSRDAETSDGDYEQAVEDLADAVVENLHDSTDNLVEPFEIYVQRTRSKVFSEANNFKMRFSKGYHVLMAELSKRDPTKE